MNKSNCLNLIQAGSYGKVIVISEKIIISHNREKFIIWNIETGRNIGEIKLDDIRNIMKWLITLNRSVLIIQIVKNILNSLLHRAQVLVDC